jgi:heptosyltransferase III
MAAGTAAPQGEVLVRKPRRAPRTILISCLRLIGDVILATPLIGVLQEAYPGVAIDFLVNRKTGEFLEKDPRVRRVIYNERFDVGANRHVEGKGYLSTIFRGYDMAINMNTADRGSIAVLAAGKRTRVGFHEPGRGKEWWKKLLFTHPLQDPGERHRVCLCLSVAQALGIRIDRLACAVYWDEADRSLVAQKLKERGVTGGYFVIHPFTRGAQKNWRMEHFAEVSDAVAKRYGLTPVWTSSPSAEEVAQLERGASCCRIKPVAMAGEFSLNQMAALLSGAQLYLGLDTAITHIAATQQIPVVALYGPSPNVYWFPWSNDRSIEEQAFIPAGTQRVGRVAVVQKEWDCVPCHSQHCRDNELQSRCLQETTPGEILDAVATLFDR